MIQKRYDLDNLNKQLNGLIFDIDYGVDAVKNVGNSNGHINVGYGCFYNEKQTL